jgi:2'-5' RNA ligase
VTDQMKLFAPDSPDALFYPDAIDDPKKRLRGYTLFYAIVPEAEDAQRIHSAAEALCSLQGLHGKCLAAARLHVTLLAVTHFSHALPQSIIDAALAAGARTSCPKFSVSMAHALSFANERSQGNHPFVLGCDAQGDQAIAMLRKSLATACKRSGLHTDPSTTPHMTMLYDKRVIAQQPIETIHWPVTRFALIVSHVGLNHYQWLGQWRLG